MLISQFSIWNVCCLACGHFMSQVLLNIFEQQLIWFLSEIVWKHKHRFETKLLVWIGRIECMCVCMYADEMGENKRNFLLFHSKRCFCFQFGSFFFIVTNLHNSEVVKTQHSHMGASQNRCRKWTWTRQTYIALRQNFIQTVRNGSFQCEVKRMAKKGVLPKKCSEK